MCVHYSRRDCACCCEGGSIGNCDQGQSQNGLEPARHRRLFLRRRRQASRRGKEDQLRGRLGLVRLRSDRRHSLGPLQRPAGAEGQVRARHDHQSLTARARMPPIAQYVFNGVVTGGMSVAGLRIGRDQLLILGVAVVLMALAQAFLLRTRLGIAMRATADNPRLAAVKGVPTERVIALATLGGGGLAGGAGVFLGLDASIDPLMGGGLIISVFAAAILGGIGSAPGALAGALIVGIMEEVGMLVVPPTYKTAIGFTIILAVLLVRPTGLAGARS